MTDDEIRKVAISYVRAQLAIMDDTTDAGIKRIGTERYEKLINDVVKTLKGLEPKNGNKRKAPRL